MKRRFFFFMIVLALHTMGCLPNLEFGEKFHLEALNNMVIGQAKSEEILHLIGGPRITEWRVIGKHRYDTYYYSYHVMGGAERIHQDLAVESKGDLLNGYIFTLESKEEKILDEQKAQRLQTGKTKGDEVKKLFGNPPGRVLVPTSFPFPDIPSDTREVWHYSYYIPLKRGIIAAYYVKELTLYFNSEGVLVWKRYYDTRKFMDRVLEKALDEMRKH